MINQILLSLFFMIVVNISLIYVYRQERLSDKWFRWLLISGNFMGIYVSQLIMGVSYKSILPVIIALIAGISLGVQGGSVVIKIGRLEKENK